MGSWVGVEVEVDVNSESERWWASQMGGGCRREWVFKYIRFVQALNSLWYAHLVRLNPIANRSLNALNNKD